MGVHVYYCWPYFLLKDYCKPGTMATIPMQLLNYTPTTKSNDLLTGKFSKLGGVGVGVVEADVDPVAIIAYFQKTTCNFYVGI